MTNVFPDIQCKIYMWIFLYAYHWWSLHVVVEIHEWSNDSESNAVRSSKLQVGLPLATSSKTKTQARRDEAQRLQQWSKCMMIPTDPSVWARGWMTNMLQKAPVEIITEWPTVRLFHSMCATEKGHEIECVGHYLTVQVHLKEIHVISAFFYPDFRSPPPKTCHAKRPYGIDDESRF